MQLNLKQNPRRYIVKVKHANKNNVIFFLIIRILTFNQSVIGEHGKINKKTSNLEKNNTIFF